MTCITSICVFCILYGCIVQCILYVVVIITAICTHHYCINVGGVPRDFEEDFVDLWLLIVFGLLSAGGIVFAIVCIVFDLLFSKKQ